MKKYLVVLLSVLAIVAFATTSYARHQVTDQFEYTPQIVKSSKAMITLGGEIRIRGEISDNNEDFRSTEDDVNSGNCVASASGVTNIDCDDSQAAWDQRVRLNLKATVSPNTLAFIELEGGNSDTSDTYSWGSTTSGASGVYQKSNTKRGDVEIRQAYIAHQGSGLLGIPAGFKVGHMLLALGNGLFYDHSKFGDDALLFWVAPMDGLEVSLITIKLSEGGSQYFADDADAYVVAVEGGMSGVNFSGDVTYVLDNSFASDAGHTNTGDANYNAELWNIGLRADADAGPVNIYGDVEFQTGTVEKFKSNQDDLDLSGWALLLGAKADINDMISVGGEFAYGSGDDIDSEDDYEGFISSIGSGQHYTYLFDQHARTAGQSASASATVSSTYTNGDNSGLNNVWYLNAGADIKATPDLKVAADIFYLQAAQKVAYDTATNDLEKKDIGVELDGKVTYQIDTNIVYYVEGGYLFAGDFYENVTMDDSEIDNPWSVRNGVLISF